MIQVSAGAKYDRALSPIGPQQRALKPTSSGEGDKPADSVLLGGKIVTLDRERVVTAVAVRASGSSPWGRRRPSL